MSSPSWSFLTDFADQAVILPLAVVVGLILGLQRRPRVALAWLSAIGSVLAVILVLKVTCFTCAWVLPILGQDQADLRSPSGHTASAAVTYGGLAALQAGRLRDRAVKLALVSATMASVVIGLSRLALGAHSVSEVVLAGCVGTAGVLAFVLLARQQIGGASHLPPLAGAACVAILAHGHHLGAEAVIQGRALPMVRGFVMGFSIVAEVPGGPQGRSLALGAPATVQRQVTTTVRDAVTGGAGSASP